MIEYTPAEIRARYREIGGDLPDDDVLRYRYGEASSGAAIWIGKEATWQPTHSNATEATPHPSATTATRH